MSPRARRWVRAGVALLLVGAAWGLVRYLREKSDREAVIRDLRARIANAESPAAAHANGEEDIPAEENAALLYIRAGDLLEGSMAREEDGAAALGVEEDAAVSAYVRGFVASNGEACALLDRAATFPRCGWKGLTPLSHFQGTQLLRLELVRGALAREAADFQEAVFCARRVLLLGRRARVVEVLEGVPLHARNSSRWAAELLLSIAVDPRLDLAGALAALDVARGLDDPWEFWGAYHRQDRHWSETVALRLLGPERRQAYEELGHEDSLETRLKDLIPGTRRRQHSPSGYPTAGDVRRALAAADATQAALDARDGTAFRPSGPIDALFTGDPDDEWPPVVLKMGGIHMGRFCCKDEAELGALRGALALRVFTLRERRPARGWEDVVPSLLPAIPRDPFTGGQLEMESLPDGHGSVGCKGWGKEVRVRW